MDKVEFKNLINNNKKEIYDLADSNTPKNSEGILCIKKDDEWIKEDIWDREAYVKNNIEKIKRKIEELRHLSMRELLEKLEEELYDLIDTDIFIPDIKNKFEVITLCGSTKFKDDFIRIERELTLKGYIVISVGLFGHADLEYGNSITEDIKLMLDEAHKVKIDKSDSIFVINKNGYIGESTRNEIAHAKSKHKKIYYMEPVEV